MLYERHYRSPSIIIIRQAFGYEFLISILPHEAFRSLTFSWECLRKCKPQKMGNIQKWSSKQVSVGWITFSLRCTKMFVFCRNSILCATFDLFTTKLIIDDILSIRYALRVWQHLTSLCTYTKHYIAKCRSGTITDVSNTRLQVNPNKSSRLISFSYPKGVSRL